MASFLNFLSTAISSLLGAGSNVGASFVLSCAGDQVTFPVSPKSFEMAHTYQNGTVNVNALGEIGMLGKRGLAMVSIASFFPAQAYGFEQTMPSGDPYGSIETLKQFAEAGQPCQLTISGTSVSTACTIQALKYGERDGSGDVYFTVDLREYRYVRPIAETVINDATGLKSRVAETVKERTITVYPGDNLMDVAARSVGQFASITQQQANKLSMFKQLAKSGSISVGQVLHVTKTRVQVADDTYINF